MFKKISFILLFCIYCTARGQTGIGYRYWFDNEYSTVINGNSPTEHLQFDIDTKELSESLHAIHIQVTDSKGIDSSPITKYFLNTHQRSSAIQGNYWFDNEQIITPYNFFNGTPVMIDVSKVSDGLHTLHLQLEGDNPSSIVSRSFIKIPQTKGVESLKCLCIVDNNLHQIDEVSSSNGIINWDVDVSNISQGVHQIQIQAITPSGAATSIHNSLFLRTATSKELSNMKCVYAIDGAKFYSQAGMLTNGAFHFDLDVANLSDGLHHIIYMLSNGKGVETKVQSQYFIKTPLGGDGVTEYKYWLNDQDENLANSVKLSERKDPFSLISLLSIAAQPIRSSCFEFRLEKGLPMIISKNDFHIRFIGANGRFTDLTTQYIDERVTQKISDVENIQSTQKFGSPKENEIIWYKMELEEGDSVTFKTSQACTMQIFSPSGKELYNASGSSSVSQDGCHTRENGAHYLAIHDTKGSNLQTSLEYEHIDKFAVLEYTPDKCSSYGSSIITLTCNGAEYVKDVELTKGSTVYKCDTLYRYDNEIMVPFILDDMQDRSELFDLKVKFDDEVTKDSGIVVINKAITLEPLKNEGISVEVATEKRVGDPYPIKVTLKNNSNVCCYGIPFYIAYDNPDKIDEFIFMNTPVAYKNINEEPSIELPYYEDLFNSGCGGLYIPMIVMNLMPYEERTYVFGVKTKIPHLKFNLYAWTGIPWYNGCDLDSSEGNSKPRLKAPSPCTPSPNIGDVMDGVNGTADIWNAFRSLVNLGKYGQAGSLLINGFRRLMQNALVFGGITRVPDEIVHKEGDYENKYEFIVSQEYAKEAAEENRFQYQIPIQVITQAIENNTKQRIFKAPSSGGDCPNPDPHTVDVYIPGDPNEITGYLSESGSHFISNDISTVFYDIEFENSPELANSSAHSITVENQLDPSVFDLNSFKPKEIILSNRAVSINEEVPFVKTIDLRPSIDAIAELRCNFDKQTGKAKWTLTSLDPVSMEPTNDIMQGVLPVNNDNGTGIGHVIYSVDLLKNLKNGKNVNNSANIVFDFNEPISTPVWTNTVDATAPTSYITACEVKKESTASLHFKGKDNLSGVWKYDVYVQYEEDTEWFNLYISHSMFQHKFRQLKHSFHRFDLFDNEKSCVPSVKSYSSHTEMLRR